MNKTTRKPIADVDFVSIPDYYLGDTLVQVSDIKLLYCDIDGTIADLTHRRQFVASQPKNWAAFEASMSEDKPIHWVIDFVNMFWHNGAEVVMMSGRGRQNLEVTEAWLDTFGVCYDNIYTRAEGDYRKDSIVKKELYHQAWIDYGEKDPDLILDDRTQVVNMWRDLGLNCIQVAWGDF